MNPVFSLRLDQDTKVNTNITDVAANECPHQFLRRSGAGAGAVDKEATITHSAGLQLLLRNVSCQGQKKKGKEKLLRSTSRNAARGTECPSCTQAMVIVVRYLVRSQVNILKTCNDQRDTALLYIK